MEGSLGDRRAGQGHECRGRQLGSTVCPVRVLHPRFLQTWLENIGGESCICMDLGQTVFLSLFPGQHGVTATAGAFALC